jgi:hypothetical protein
MALLATMLLGSALILTPKVVGHEIGHDADLVDYLVIAWFVASLATIAGAPGRGPRVRRGVREAGLLGGPSEAGADEQKRHRRRQTAA